MRIYCLLLAPEDRRNFYVTVAGSTFCNSDALRGCYGIMYVILFYFVVKSHRPGSTVISEFNWPFVKKNIIKSGTNSRDRDYSPKLTEG